MKIFLLLLFPWNGTQIPNSIQEFRDAYKLANFHHQICQIFVTLHDKKFPFSQRRHHKKCRLYSLSKNIVHITSGFTHTSNSPLAAQWHQLIGWKCVIHVCSVCMIEHISCLNYVRRKGKIGKILVTIQFQDKPDFQGFIRWWFQIGIIRCDVWKSHIGDSHLLPGTIGIKFY